MVRRPRSSVACVICWSSAQICWPLGTAVEATPAGLCAQKLSAWTLNGAIPPTLPDRASERSLHDTIWLDPVSGLRTTPACTPNAEQRAIARWPTYLEPWLSADERARSAPAWRAGCQHEESNTGSIKLQGIAAGAQIRPAPGKTAAQLDLRAAGGSGSLYWLLNGKLLRTAPADQGQRIELRDNGEHTITVMDAQGRYASARFVVKGF